MTRLFLRFYFGVICILVITFAILGYVFRQRNEPQAYRVIEQALSGGVRLAQLRLAAADEASFEPTLQAIQQSFDYPVYLVPFTSEQVGEPLHSRLLAGDVVFQFNRMLIALPDNKHLMAFGPLPEFAQPTPTEVVLGYGAIFLLAAIAIALLLRPVVSQLRAVERTATAIAGGDLSARIDPTSAKRSIALAGAFNTMADRTETLLKSQRELLQSVSHELRTPLARIRFATELIETAPTDELRRSRLESVDKATQELDDLVGELLSYVRLESVATHAKLDRVNIKLLLREQISSVQSLYPSVHISIEDESEPVIGVVNQTSLSRAIKNLLTNACRYAKSRVAMRVLHQANQVVIEVDDDGEGIPATDRAKVFEPFVRLKNTQGRGSGLGLALVDRIVKSHGGHAEVLDSPGGGARFRITIHAN
ncbi:ATP-binding protein [Novipirellula artificiosorum]|uniref:histidine kinase n=1 Tax=Novipirellula artificiosorum TaxID=2528016 RepID=A0A5C6DMU5_9BACT|nr:ATP-binding protein [Novipirellula artificiosorum]TWU37177.1 Sensor protein RstB [Novipirellula artificiosorum]